MKGKLHDGGPSAPADRKRPTAAHGEQASSQPAAARRPSPQVAVARRIDSARPARVWSLLLPPSFLRGDRE